MKRDFIEKWLVGNIRNQYPESPKSITLIPKSITRLIHYYDALILLKVERRIIFTLLIAIGIFILSLCLTIHQMSATKLVTQMMHLGVKLLKDVYNQFEFEIRSHSVLEKRRADIPRHLGSLTIQTGGDLEPDVLVHTWP